MKIRRYKKAARNLNFYAVNFGFHKPFQLLIDGTFCYASLQNRIQIKEEIPKYLGEEVKFLTTACVIVELDKLGNTLTATTQIAKSFGIHRCGHNKTSLTGSQCLLSMVAKSNPSRYIIATQDTELQSKLECLPSVPVIYINRTSIVLKSPSEASLKAAKDITNALTGLTTYQESTLKDLKLKAFGSLPTDEPQEECYLLKKIKKPNPLSRLKKRKSTPTDKDEKLKPSKRKRKKIRFPKHVKEELKSKNNSQSNK